MLSGLAPRKGLEASMGWTAVQVSAKAACSLRRSRRSCSRRTDSPSAVVSLRTRVSLRRASTIWFPRAFAMRNMSEGVPSQAVTTATRLKSTRAVGREKRAKTRPVVTASPIIPSSASIVTRTFPPSVRGAILP